MFVTGLCLLETHMWFVIGLHCGSCGINTSDDSNEDRSGTVTAH